jgi:hypothetical protein
MVLFLGRSADFRAYLAELKEEAALSRLRQAAYDLLAHTSKVKLGG